MKFPNHLTDSTAGTPSPTAVAALSDGSTYANDVAAIRNNLSTLTVTLNTLTDIVRGLQKRVEALDTTLVS
jgi:hypothetical protein